MEECREVVAPRNFMNSEIPRAESDRAQRVIFVTGTDTGVGKTTVTASLVWYLRANGVQALAMKPFCSGSRADVKLLQSMQSAVLSDEEANPFYFSEAVAPLIALRETRQIITLKQTVAKVRAVQMR